MKLKDKVAIITGAAQGIGLACAERLFAEGAKLFLVDIQDDKLAKASAKFGDRASTHVCDLSAINSADAAKLVVEAVAKFGSVDVLVANAGVMHVADFVDFPEDEFDRVQRINVKSRTSSTRSLVSTRQYW